MNDFLAMGGYGAFIWPAYGVSLVALIGIVWQSWAAWRVAKKKLDALEQDRA
jgi:heme exporter protein D